MRLLVFLRNKARLMMIVATLDDKCMPNGLHAMYIMTVLRGYDSCVTSLHYHIIDMSQRQMSTQDAVDKC